MLPQGVKMCEGSHDVTAVLNSEIAACETYLTKLKEALALIQGSCRPNYSLWAPAISHDQFVDKPLHVCIRQYLELISPRGATDEEILQALEAGGWPRKKYPKRQISISITNSQGYMERREDDRVYLKRKEVA